MDSFLDGVNVERLAALIARQAEQAQFLVVSHRRPMIGASTRTIGVTQARGAHPGGGPAGCGLTGRGLLLASKWRKSLRQRPAVEFVVVFNDPLANVPSVASG